MPHMFEIANSITVKIPDSAWSISFVRLGFDVVVGLTWGDKETFTHAIRFDANEWNMISEKMKG